MRPFRAVLLGSLAAAVLLLLISTANAQTEAPPARLVIPAAAVAGGEYLAYVDANAGYEYTLTITPAIPGYSPCGTGSCSGNKLIRFTSPPDADKVTIKLTSASVNLERTTTLYKVADVALTLEAPDTFVVGADFPATLRVTNNGPSSSEGRGVWYASRGGFSGATSITWDKLASGQSRAFPITLSGSGNSFVVVSATTDFLSYDRVLSNNFLTRVISPASKTSEDKAIPAETQDGGTETASGPKDRLVSVTLAVIPESFAAGSSQHVSFDIKREIVDTVPDSMTYIADVDGVAVASQVVSTASLRNPQGATLGFQVPPTGKTLTVSVTLNGQTLSASKAITIVTPTFSLTGPSELMEGQPGSYLLDVKSSQSGVYQVPVTVTGGSCASTCKIIARGGTATNSFSTIGLKAGTPLVVTMTPPDGKPLTITTAIKAASTNLVFEQFTANPASPRDGQHVEITMKIANKGEVSVKDAFVKLPLPSGLSAGDISGLPCIVIGNEMNCAMGYIGAGGSITRTFSFIASTGSYNIGGSVGSSLTDTNPGDNARSLSVTVTPA